MITKLAKYENKKNELGKYENSTLTNIQNKFNELNEYDKRTFISDCLDIKKFNRNEVKKYYPDEIFTFLDLFDYYFNNSNQFKGKYKSIDDVFEIVLQQDEHYINYFIKSILDFFEDVFNKAFINMNFRF